MRGKVDPKKINDYIIGITPAYAGKRNSRVYQQIPQWDHPRLCGEKSNSFSMASAYIGSPPPMRGKVSVHGVSRCHAGITPAYAGKSF